MIVAPVGHAVDPKSWLCTGCHRPYPCPVTRAWLVVVYGRGPAVAVWAAQLLTQAAAAMPELTPADLFVRFLAWTEPDVR